MTAARRFSIAVLLAAAACAPRPPAPAWEPIEDGLEFRSFPGCDESRPEERIHVLRADPRRFRLTLLAASALENGRALPAPRWAADHGLAVATNAGMYHPDLERHVGLMIDHDHENNPVAVSDYKSVLAFNPSRQGLEAFVLADLEETTLDRLREDYRTLIQNLRMISHRRENVWSPSDRKTTAAALGVDAAGNLLFLFSGASCSVHEFNERLLRLPIDLQRAQYLEGGPEASLFASAGGRTLGWSGVVPSAESAGEAFWPIPNVIGLERVEPPATE